MEDVLALYAEPADGKRPVVCFDETPRQLIVEERVPTRAEPGKRARYDYEYVRNDTANVFMFVDVTRPWTGSALSSTICPRTRRRRSTSASNLQKRDASSSASDSISRRSTRAG